MEKVKLQCSKLLSANLRVTWGTREENFLQDNLRNIFYPQANSLFKIPGLEPSHESERLFSLNKLYTATTTPSDIREGTATVFQSILTNGVKFKAFFCFCKGPTER